jgi:dihydrolipoamide dehydrogenase
MDVDVAVIGAGTAGLAAERSARRAGAKTLLIDDRFAGTTCATVGCMPSKLLIAAARAAHSVASSSKFGIGVDGYKVDGPAVLRRVRQLRDEFVQSTLKSIDELPDGVRLQGMAKFVGPNLLQVGAGQVRAKSIVVATGASPSIPKLLDNLDGILTNETVFELKDIPRSMAVLGAGPLGLELAQAFARLGARVAVFDEGEKIAALKDGKVAEVLHRLLAREFDLNLGTTIHSARNIDGGVELSLQGRTSGVQVFDCILLAAGRPPNVRALGLENSHIELNEHGVPIFDRNSMQCQNSSIFMAGDADADVPVLHEASAEGAIAGYNAASFPDIRKFPRATPFAITFVDPAVATVGKPASHDTIIGAIDFIDQGRAKVDGINSGILRLYADRNGCIEGACMAAPEGEHLAHLIAWAIETKQTAMSLLAMPIYHPTLEEGLRTALRQICKQIDSDIPGHMDQGSVPGI